MTNTIKRSGSPSVEVTFYLEDQGDPVLAKYIARAGLSGKTLRLDGRANASEGNPSVVSCSTTKRMGPAAGTMTCTLKAPTSFGTRLPALEDLLPDDTWFDVTVIDAGVRSLVMRGLTRGVARNESGGPTSWTVNGEDFGRIFASTNIWFNRFAAGTSAITSDVQAASQILQKAAGPPDEVVKALLFTFLASFTDAQVYSWRTPDAMLQQGGRAFADAVVFDKDDFVNTPNRIGPALSIFNPGIENRTLWDIASQWSDPQFCELFCDIAPPLPQKYLGQAINPDEGFMAVTFRDRPFPRLDLNRNSLWFKIPQTSVDPTEVVSEATGRSGDERFNSFAVGPSLLQTVGASAFLGSILPVWDQRSVQQHGLRRFDVDSAYFSGDGKGQFTLSEYLKDRAIDFFALNPYFLSGSVDLARVRPEIRIGQRFRISASASRAERTYYVEEVTHRMTASRCSTSLGVTRGWSGGADSMMSALGSAKARYRSVAPAGTGDLVDISKGIA